LSRRIKQRATATPRIGFISKPGRPTADQAAAISRAILGAATDCFLASGFEGTSMEAIAAKSGVPKSTLYKRFPDKKSILRAVLEQRVAAWSVAASQQNRVVSDDIEKRLKQYVVSLVIWGTSSEVRAFSGLAASAWGGVGETLSRLDVIGFSSMVTFLENDIREFGPRSGIAARDPRRVAMALMAMVSGWLAFRTSPEQAAGKEAANFADMAVELLIHGSSAW